MCSSIFPGTRMRSCRLLAVLAEDGGRLRIEVPDLVLTGLAAFNPFASLRRRCVAERHLFGSHEAEWAAHREAYSAGQLRRLVCSYGFAVERMARNSWAGTFNIDLSASSSAR